jgi:hypothetical protein
MKLNLRTLYASASPDCRAMWDKAAVKRHGKPAPRLGNGMNKSERAYADHLAMLKLAGEVGAYEWTGNRRKERSLPSIQGHRYTPDFYVYPMDGTTEYHEVKGWRFIGGMLLFDGAAQANPGNVFRMVQRTKNGWEEIRVRNAKA